MRKTVTAIFTLVLLPLAAPGVAGAGVTAVPAGAQTAAYTDDLSDPLQAKQRAARSAALDALLSGRAGVERRGSSVVARIDAARSASQGNRRRTDQYVELSRERTDKVFVILAEFGDERHPDYPDVDTDPATPGPVRFDGPGHNEIPRPNRANDNSTIWQPDYPPDHYRRLYFGSGRGVESVRTWYERQSSGRYSVDGAVTDWVRVRYNEARYGRSNGYPCAGWVCANSWELIRDAVDAWVAGQHARGRSDAQIAADLAEFDVWDRYDHDADGDFNEPDGYLDHFQIVHAGGDQADADPWQGEDAISSHRSAAFPSTEFGPGHNRAGGVQIGATGLWIRDYTMQPENGGLSVFVHEYAHDLGLPDLYDSAAVQPETENPVHWWSVMAQNRVSAAHDQGVGVRVNDFGPWEKLQLGWLDYEIVRAGENRAVTLGPHEYRSTRPQAVVVTLPKKKVITELAVPPEGVRSWWSGSGNALDNTLTRDIAVPDGPAELTFSAWWDIEDCGAYPCDYAFVEVSTGDGFTALPGSITRPAEGNAIDGTSGGWQDARFDLSRYAGRTITLRLRYTTDGSVAGKGLLVDNIVVMSGGRTVFADGAEAGPNGWALAGFTAAGGTVVDEYDNYYLASHRSYVSFDRYLRTGPYNFGFQPALPNLVEHFPYQQGLLVWYWDTSFEDNNTSEHPGGGLILPVDARPQLIRGAGGRPWRPRIQAYDAPFSLRRADSFPLHIDGKASWIRGQAAVPVFSDARSYYAEDPVSGMRYGVKVPQHGVHIRVLTEVGTSMRIRVTSG
ncbi:immune inhibitor A [Plantactinospora mayteni]|uniref:Protease n=1 Tax=Plantactinospora mayteni TaxID=566021 RepID=A0ABQ4EUB6_9ACTN|nr:immune inhibitor A domain-containing protein [Plantactinospora mayteni]GIG98252.1 protease [Plantactinospora mayteni]